MVDVDGWIGWLNSIDMHWLLSSQVPKGLVIPLAFLIPIEMPKFNFLGGWYVKTLCNLHYIPDLSGEHPFTRFHVSTSFGIFWGRLNFPWISAPFRLLSSFLSPIAYHSTFGIIASPAQRVAAGDVRKEISISSGSLGRGCLLVVPWRVSRLVGIPRSQSWRKHFSGWWWLGHPSEKY